MKHNVTRKLAPLAAVAAAAVALSVSPSSPASAGFGGGGGPQDADPYLSVSNRSGVPLEAKATNMRQSDSTPIVISSATPGVCTVPANSTSVGTYQSTPSFSVSIVGSGTCIIQADQAASSRYVAGHTERSYTVN